MEMAGVFFAFLTGLFSAALAGIALWKRIQEGIRHVVSEVLVDTGLAKRGERNQMWPNGSDNLPDFLEHLWQKINGD